MKTKSLRNKNAAFYVMLAMIAVILIVCVPIAEVLRIEGVIFNWCLGALGIAFGVSGLVVVLLTISLQEAIIQKLFFILAGGAVSLSVSSVRGYGAAETGVVCCAFTLAHSDGVNCLISVIFAEGRRVNRSLR